MLENNQKGISLYISFMIMAILLSVALGLNTIFIGQTKTIRGIGNSVIALSAADAGIERILLDRNNPSDIPETELSSNGATYQVFVTLGGTINCPATHYCVKSVGSYQGTRRAIEITY
ncbi:MAG: hypothetical protein Q8P63_02260 [Candidatus Nealsonbacteria bacterium]|nr:hypothetical protein [Candidatus Nealsonbacteria bacterium]